MIKKYLKNNKGVTMTDIITAIIILSIFVGTIGEIYYSIALNNTKIRLNAIATYYAVQVAEDIDKTPYEDVTTEDLTEKLSDEYEFLEEFIVTATVTNYNTINESADDMIKIVEINVNYTIKNETITYSLRKIKIKEM